MGSGYRVFTDTSSAQVYALKSAKENPAGAGFLLFIAVSELRQQRFQRFAQRGLGVGVGFAVREVLAVAATAVLADDFCALPRQEAGEQLEVVRATFFAR